jgi:hypothetical protein
MVCGLLVREVIERMGVQRLVNLRISDEFATIVDLIKEQSLCRVFVYTLEEVAGGYRVFGMLYQQEMQKEADKIILYPHSAVSEVCSSKEYLYKWMSDYVRQKTAELAANYRAMGDMVEQVYER